MDTFRLAQFHKNTLLLVTAMLLINTAIACSCIGLGEISTKEINELDGIFIGRVIEVSPEKKQDNGDINTMHFQQYKVTLKVLRAYKGVERKENVTIYTATSGSACGLNFDVDEKWFVFGHNYNNKLHAGLCSRSRDITAKDRGDKKYRSERKFLNKNL